MAKNVPDPESGQPGKASMPGSRAPTTLVIFGASGDLTWRKLIPALYNNYQKGRLQACDRIVGFARRPYSDETFRLHLQEGVAQFSPKSFSPAAGRL